MKNSIFTILSFLFFFQISLQAQDHTVVVSGIDFTPQDLTITVGETVAWDNQGGVHNVNGSQQSFPGNPEGFSSGAPANAPWTFTHTFNTPGVYNYQCDVHFSQGMTGTITVKPAGDVIITEFMYNNPGTDDYEFLELYNNGTESVDMEGWMVTDAVDFTFPAFTLDPGAYVVVAKSAPLFEAAFGLLPQQWDSGGALNNTGETIILRDASGAVVDSVAYEAGTGGWPIAADGQGPSNVLCDYDADNNDPASWAASTTSTGFDINGTEVLADPGADSGCPAGPSITFQNAGFTVPENAGSVFASVIMSNGNGNPTEVTLVANMNSTAINGEDFNLSLPFTVMFDPSEPFDTQTVTINIVDDMDIESTEVLFLELTDPTNNGVISGISQFELSIIDDDTPISGSLLITGVYDTQPAGAGVKGIELQAVEDIPDLSIFGIGSASNGGGSDGVEANLPAISVLAGDCIYVATDSTDFFDFFGFYPTMSENFAVSINGDDAIEVFENEQVIDVFGEINHGGQPLPWSYLDGWAYRKSGTGPDGTIFNIDNWTFSGENALDDVVSNGNAPNPFPECTYTSILPTEVAANDDNVTIEINETVTINVLGNDITPNPLISLTITNAPSNGTATANGLIDIAYTPNPDYCGSDQFTYEICDDNGCDEAVVNITINCPPSYPPYDIADVTTVNADGRPDSLEVRCQLQGIVHGINFQESDNRLQFSLIDGTGGITVFEFDDFGYDVTEGDELIVRGEIDDFNCLTEMRVDTLWVVSQDNPLTAPLTTIIFTEDLEAELAQFNNASFVDPAEWLGDGSSFEVMVENTGGVQRSVFIDNDTELASMPAPTEPFHVIGLITQYDENLPCDVGYQLQPRYMEDFILLNNTEEELLASQIQFFPNPVKTTLFLQTEQAIDRIVVSNLLGQQVLIADHPGNKLDVSGLQPGMHLITFEVGEIRWTSKVLMSNE